MTTHPAIESFRAMIRFNSSALWMLFIANLYAWIAIGNAWNCVGVVLAIVAVGVSSLAQASFTAAATFDDEGTAGDELHGRRLQRVAWALAVASLICFPMSA